MLHQSGYNLPTNQKELQTVVICMEVTKTNSTRLLLNDVIIYMNGTRHQHNRTSLLEM